MKLYLRTFASFLQKTTGNGNWIFIGDDEIEVIHENLAETEAEFKKLIEDNIESHVIEEGKNPYLTPSWGGRFTEDEFVELTPEQYELYTKRKALTAEMKVTQNRLLEEINKAIKFADEHKLSFDIGVGSYDGKEQNWDSSY